MSTSTASSALASGEVLRLESAASRLISASLVAATVGALQLTAAAGGAGLRRTR